MVNKTTRKRGKRSGGAGAEAVEAGEIGAVEVGAGEAGEAEVAKAKAKAKAKAEAAKAKAEAAKEAGEAEAAAEIKKAEEAPVAEASPVVVSGADAKEREGADAKVVKGTEGALGAEVKGIEGTLGADAKEREGEPGAEPAKEREGEPGAEPAKERDAKADGTPNTPEGILDALQKNSPEAAEAAEAAEKLQKEAGESGSQEELLDALKTAQTESGAPGAPGAFPIGNIVITTQPDNEVKKAVIKGGEALKDTIYKLFSSILLLTSYLLFCFATVLFINACININFLNKEVKDKDENSPIAMQPVFDYLKPNNFMFLDKFLLEPQSPVFITFIIIIGVSLACLGLLIGYWSYVSDPNRDERYDYWKESIIPKFPNIRELIQGNINEIKDTKNAKETKNIKKFEALLKYLPYLYILIILSSYNGITNDNRINLENLKKDTFDSDFKDFDTNTYKTFTKKENQSGSIFLKELKNIIIRYIYNDILYNRADIIRELENKLGEPNANVSTVINSNIITKTIFDIYGKYYKYPVDPKKYIKDENDKFKHHKLTYINYINNYFNLLINDAEQSNAKTKTNYYARFYLIGLIKKDILNDKDATDIAHLFKLKDALDIKLEGVKNRIRGYYIAVITFYVLFICLICGFYWKDIGLYIWDLLVGYKLNNWRAALIITIVFIILLVYGILFATKNKI